MSFSFNVNVQNANSSVQNANSSVQNANIDSPMRETTTKHEGKNIKSRFSVTFKLKLISEVKKHAIIWKITHKKPKSIRGLVNDAWVKIGKKFSKEEIEVCQSQWKLLIQSFKNDLKGKHSMNVQIRSAMKFMTSYYKLPTSPGRKAKTAKSADATPSTSTQEPTSIQVDSELDPNNQAVVSESNQYGRGLIAILDLLLARGSSDEEFGVLVKSCLVEFFKEQMPDEYEKIYEHGIQCLKRGENAILDWSPVGLPAEACNAIWNYQQIRMLPTIPTV